MQCACGKRVWAYSRRHVPACCSSGESATSSACLRKCSGPLTLPSPSPWLWPLKHLQLPKHTGLCTCCSLRPTSPFLLGCVVNACSPQVTPPQLRHHFLLDAFLKWTSPTFAPRVTGPHNITALCSPPFPPPKSTGTAFSGPAPDTQTEVNACVCNE